MFSFNRGVTPIIFMALSFISTMAIAELGAKEDSIDTVQRNLNLQHRLKKSNSAYVVHMLSNDSLTIWEFASSNGTVFAVAWKGLNHPDLSKVLGKYFDEFSNTIQGAPRHHGNRHDVLTGKNVVVEKWKEMEWARGFAYVPALMPEKAMIGDIGKEIYGDQ